MRHIVFNCDGIAVRLASDDVVVNPLNRRWGQPASISAPRTDTPFLPPDGL